MSKTVIKCACGKRYGLPSDAGGKKFKCPSCQAALTVPSAAEQNPLELAASFEQSASTLAPSGAAYQPTTGLAKKSPSSATERQAISAELHQLRSQSASQFLTRHQLLETQAAISTAMQEAKARADQGNQVGGKAVTPVAYFLSGGNVILGGFLEAAIRTLLPWRRGSNSIDIRRGQTQLEGLSAATADYRRSTSTLQQRIDALETISAKEPPFFAVATARLGSGLFSAIVTFVILVIALLMMLAHPFCGLIFGLVALWGGRWVKRETKPLAEAIRDYPAVGSELGSRLFPVSAHAASVVVLSLACVISLAGIVVANYRWVQTWGPLVATTSDPPAATVNKKPEETKVAAATQSNPETNAPLSPALNVAPAIPPAEPASPPGSETTDTKLTDVPATEASTADPSSAPSVADPTPTSSIPTDPLASAPKRDRELGSGMNDSKVTSTLSKGGDDQQLLNPDWRLVTGTETRFKVEFPTKETYVETPNFLIKDVSMIRTWMATMLMPGELERAVGQSNLTGAIPLRGLIFEVAELEFVRTIPRRDFVRLANETAASKLPSALAKPKPQQTGQKTTGNFSRDWFALSPHQEHVHVRVVIRGQYLYVLLAKSPDDQWDSWIDRFLNSFQLASENKSSKK